MREPNLSVYFTFIAEAVQIAPVVFGARKRLGEMDIIYYRTYGYKFFSLGME